MLIALSIFVGIGAYQIVFIDSQRVVPWMGLEKTTSVVLIVTPILSISTIVAMLLFGAFRRFKDDDIGKIDARSLLAEALKSSQGS